MAEIFPNSCRTIFVIQIILKAIQYPLEASGRLVADEDSDSTEVSTVEEEELSALMGEKEDYNKDDEQNEEQWED